MKRNDFLSWALRPINALVNKRLASTLQESNYYLINNSSPEDVFIVGYPKSGNTWVQSLIAGILYGIDTEILPDSLVQEIVPDVHFNKFFKRFSDITFFKSHHLPRRNYKKVIYLVRDGRDVMLSYLSWNRIQGAADFLEDMIIDGKGLFPSKWNEHVEQWHENSFNAEILYIRYEDLLVSPNDELKKICDFSGMSRSGTIIKRAVDGCSFKKMQQKESRFGISDTRWKGDSNKNRFFRQGRAGSYKTEFPEELLSLFEKQSRKALDLFGYE